MGDLLKGPDRWTEHARAQASSEVVHLFVGSGGAENFRQLSPTEFDDVVRIAKTPVEPRKEFGRKPRVHSMQGAIAAALDICRDTDKLQQERVKSAARAARDAHDGKSHVCETLLIGLAGEAQAIAEASRRLAHKLEALRQTQDALTFFDLADLIETRAAAIEAPAHKGDV